jgi:hypothetical protein
MSSSPSLRSPSPQNDRCARTRRREHLAHATFVFTNESSCAGNTTAPLEDSSIPIHIESWEARCVFSPVRALRARVALTDRF